MKMNIAGVEYEGSPQELKELFDLLSDTKFEESKEEYRKVVRSPREGDYKVVPDPEFEVGDYVVALSAADEGYYYTNTNMKLGKVVEICGDGDIKIEVVRHENDSNEGQTFDVDRRFFRKATDEEVAQAKAEHERKQAEQKWAKIGRKPGEFKKGDIVRVVEYTGAHEIGEIVELAKDCANEYLGNDGAVLVGEPEWFELIAPVESRVDIND